MSNSTDKPSEEEQQKDSGQAVGGTDAYELSEQSLRKRDLPGTPHSSPPRFVSVEELMETAKGVTNLALAHEIVVNGDFQVKPAQPAEGSLQKRVKDIMHRVFWDCLDAQLKEDPPMYDHAIKLLAEIKEFTFDGQAITFSSSVTNLGVRRTFSDHIKQLQHPVTHVDCGDEGPGIVVSEQTLLSFLLPGHRRLRNQIEEGLDLALILQQAEKDTLDINTVAGFIIGMMGTLCAPSRDEEIQKLRAITGIAPLFRAIFQVLDLMKIDMANFAVSSIRPHLLQQSVEYERKKFQEFLDKQPNALEFTQKWLQDAAKVLLTCRQEEQVPGQEATAPRASVLSPLSLHNHAYLRLLKWDHAAMPFPETLLMDQSRFQEMQLELEQLSMTAAVLLVVYNSAGAALTGLPDLMRRLKSAALVLLAAIRSPSFDAEEVFSTIAEKMCAEVASCLVQHGFSSLSPDGQHALKGQITAVRCPDTSIRKLIDSRIHTFLLGFLESSSQRSIPPLPGGLAPIQKELEGIAVKLSRLVNYNKLVFAPYYQKILQDVLEEAARAGTSLG